MKVKPTLIKLHWLLSSQFGLNPQIFWRSLRGIPAFLRDLKTFKKGHQGKILILPCLHDRYEEGGETKSEYFWQDLLVAQAIHEAKPVKHVDIGSRIDGFVAHVASFRECEVFDVRPISTKVPGVVFHQADLMNPVTLPTTGGEGYCDSLSCLHAIEHFGLGRYGDPINPVGYKQGIANMAKLLQSGGIFYLSTPIGDERVEFNSNWIFHPSTIVQVAENEGLKLQKLIIITPTNEQKLYQAETKKMADLTLQKYQLGLFIFTKTHFS